MVAVRSDPARLNVGCSASTMWNTMSPGSWPGTWSASPSRTILSPSLVVVVRDVCFGGGFGFGRNESAYLAPRGM